MSSQAVVQQPKVCSQCNVDLNKRKRYKTAQGRYLCEKCAAAVTAAAHAPSTQKQAPATSDKQNSEMPSAATIRSLGLVGSVTCPHCWHRFAPSQVLWISQHQDLIGDPIAGEEKPRRFLPTRFTPDAQALDARGVACQMLACPHCHLSIPRSIVEAEPLFISIVGGPKTGKSYFLASMIWELRRRMPSDFGLAFQDADTVSNQTLNNYEAILFLPQDPDRLVAIEKTDTEGGEWYDQVQLGGRPVNLPRPFLFNLRPTPRHPNAVQRETYSRVLCMYDNAGEHFQPGMDRSGSPVTQHLAKSRAIIFLFDPTQDPRFRDRCSSLSKDPQVTVARNTQRQETLLIEAGLRVRRYANLPPNKKHQCPLIVVVAKSDVWAPLLDQDIVKEPILSEAVGGVLSALDGMRIETVSSRLRDLLLKYTPELIAAAEDFCETVIYIPVSALGCSPEQRPQESALLVRPSAIAPRWVCVPILYMFAKWASGLIAANVQPAHAVPQQATAVQ